MIVAVTDKPEVARCLALWHGVLPIVCELDGDTEQVIARVVEAAVKRALPRPRARRWWSSTPPPISIADRRTSSASAAPRVRLQGGRYNDLWCPRFSRTCVAL